MQDAYEDLAIAGKAEKEARHSAEVAQTELKTQVRENADLKARLSAAEVHVSVADAAVAAAKARLKEFVESNLHSEDSRLDLLRQQLERSQQAERAALERADTLTVRYQSLV